MPSKFCWPLMSRPFPFCGVVAFETSSCFPTQPLIFYVTVSFTLRPTPTIHIITQSLTRNKQKPKATKKEARSRRPCFFFKIELSKNITPSVIYLFLEKESNFGNFTKTTDCRSGGCRGRCTIFPNSPH